MATHVLGRPHQMPAAFNAKDAVRIHFSVRHSHTRSNDRANCVNPARARLAAASTSSPTHTHSLSASTRSSAARAINRARLLIRRGRSAQDGTGASVSSPRAQSRLKWTCPPRCV